MIPKAESSEPDLKIIKQAFSIINSDSLNLLFLHKYENYSDILVRALAYVHRWDIITDYIIISPKNIDDFLDFVKEEPREDFNNSMLLNNKVLTFNNLDKDCVLCFDSHNLIDEGVSFACTEEIYKMMTALD